MTLVEALKVFDFSVDYKDSISLLGNKAEIEPLLVKAAETYDKYKNHENRVSEEAGTLLDESIKDLNCVKAQLSEHTDFYKELEQKIQNLQEVSSARKVFAKANATVAAATVAGMMSHLKIITKNFYKLKNGEMLATRFCKSYLNMSEYADNEFFQALSTVSDYVKYAESYNREMTDETRDRYFQCFDKIERVVKSTPGDFDDLSTAITAAKKPLLPKQENPAETHAHSLSARQVAAGVFLLGVVSFAIASAVTGNIAGFMQAGNMTKNCFAAFGVIAGATGASFYTAYNRKLNTANTYVVDQSAKQPNVTLKA